MLQGNSEQFPKCFSGARLRMDEKMVFDFESGLAGPAQAGNQPAQQVSAPRTQAICIDDINLGPALPGQLLAPHRFAGTLWPP